MPFFGQILVGIISTGLVSLLGVYVLQRKLCAYTQYFPYSTISNHGKTVAITLVNRGRRSEADLNLQLDPARQYTMLASSSAGVRMQVNIVELDRLAGYEDVTAVVLVEGGDFNNEHILSLSSKETKGRVYESLEKLPAPPMGVPIVVAFLVFFFAFPIYGVYYAITSGGHPERMIDVLSGESAHRIDALERIGWHDPTKFISTSMSDDYDVGEFPVSVTNSGRDGDVIKFDVSITNKTKDWLTVTVSLKGTAQKISDSKSIVNNYESDIVVPSGGAAIRKMTVYLPESVPQAVRLEASLSSGDDSLYGMWCMLIPGHGL